MIVLGISLIILSIILGILWKVLHEPRGISTTLAIMMFILASLLFSRLIAPTTTITTEYGICQLILQLEQDEGKSNNDIIASLEDEVNKGYDTLIIQEIRYSHTKLAYFKIMYPKRTMIRLVNRNQTFLK